MESPRRGGKIDAHSCCVGSAVSVFLLDPRVLYQCRSLKSVRCIMSVGWQIIFPLRTVTFYRKKQFFFLNSDND